MQRVKVIPISLSELFYSINYYWNVTVSKYIMCTCIFWCYVQLDEPSSFVVQLLIYSELKRGLLRAPIIFVLLEAKLLSCNSLFFFSVVALSKRWCPSNRLSSDGFEPKTNLTFFIDKNMLFTRRSSHHILSINFDLTICKLI